MTDIPDSATHAATEVRVVFSRLRRRLREVAKLDELTPSQTSVLSRLDKGGPASSSALAAAEQVRPQSMAATIAAIEQAGLIIRTPDPADGRKQLISLSALGRERIGVSRQAREEWMARALADDFTEDERRTIIAALALLDRLADR
ncbi:MarR family winged helix-turn-helix transcriptional regulator [Actinoplanes sp. NPDC000266]